MSAYVLKRWKAQTSPIDEAGNMISISGRESGLIAWLLARVGIDPTMTLNVSSKRIEFRASSLSGTNNRMIPLGGVCSTYYGYHKPWKQALGIFALLMWLIGSLAAALESGGAIFLGFLVSVGISVAYYYLNRTLMIGIVENSGVVSGILFKKSVIENVDIDETQARIVCELTQAIIEAAKEAR